MYFDEISFLNAHKQIVHFGIYMWLDLIYLFILSLAAWTCEKM